MTKRAYTYNSDVELDAELDASAPGAAPCTGKAKGRRRLGCVARSTGLDLRVPRGRAGGSGSHLAARRPAPCLSRPRLPKCARCPPRPNEDSLEPLGSVLVLTSSAVLGLRAKKKFALALEKTVSVDARTAFARLAFAWRTVCNTVSCCVPILVLQVFAGSRPVFLWAPAPPRLERTPLWAARADRQSLLRRSSGLQIAVGNPCTPCSNILALLSSFTLPRIHPTHDQVYPLCWRPSQALLDTTARTSNASHFCSTSFAPAAYTTMGSSAAMGGQMARLSAFVYGWTPMILLASYCVISFFFYIVIPPILQAVLFYIYLVLQTLTALSVSTEALQSVRPSVKARRAFRKAAKEGWGETEGGKQWPRIDVVLVAYLPNEKDIIMRQLRYALREINLSRRQAHGQSRLQYAQADRAGGDRVARARKVARPTARDQGAQLDVQSGQHQPLPLARLQVRYHHALRYRPLPGSECTSLGGQTLPAGRYRYHPGVDAACTTTTRRG
ncbi:hypothetical protein L1887_62169 [Cichorium endivia]|nr:hypothetical protein L1887_62169 [Cichorium endivia]